MRWPLRHGRCGPTTREIGLALAVALAIVVVTSQVAAFQERARPLDPGAVALIMVATLALAWRSCSPMIVFGVVVALVAGNLLIGYPYGPIQVCLVFAMFEVARTSALRTSLLACLAGVLVTATAIFARTFVHLVEPDVPLDLLALWVALWSSWLVVPWSVGALIQVRSAAARRGRQELVARTRLEERLRLAREVHDAAGHGLAAVAMQAGVALLVLDERPDQARASLEAIRATSTAALADLRATLEASPRKATVGVGALASEDAGGLRGLAALAANVRAAGLPVQLSVDDMEVPEATGLVAYRVVQEALTNTLRHAGPTTADVRVRRDRDMLVVEVLDDGAGTAEVRPGSGLTGMRERVVAVGGELIVGPRERGGFWVCARLPLGREAT